MLKVGVSKQKITPKLGTLLAGYPWERPAKGVADDLDVSAIALSCESEMVLLISATVTEISTPILDEIKEKITKKFGVDKIIFCSTHTHSSPILLDMAGWGKADIEYKDTVLIPQTLLAVQNALGNLKIAKVGVGVVDSTVGVNRRELRADGKIYLGENYNGVFDKRMHVISFVGVDDKPICNIVHYGAHGTSISGPEDALYVSRDWPGGMVDALEKESGAISVFFNGVEGDVAPRKIPNMSYGLEMMRKIGEKAGKDACEAYGSIKEFKSANVKTVKGTIKLSYDPLISIDVAKEELKKFTGELDGERELEKNKWLEVIKAHSEEKKTHISFEQTVLSIGDIAFVPFPFEPFSEIGLNLAVKSPFKVTLSLSNANGCNGYLPSSTEIEKGGYEVWEFKNGRAYVLTDNADKEIVQENLKLLNQLKK